MRAIFFNAVLRLVRARGGARRSRRFKVRCEEAPEGFGRLTFWRVKRRERRAPFRFAAAMVFGAVLLVRAQNPSPTESNTMMQLMMSQAPVDISSPVVVTATFDPPVVRPGELSVYRITLNATEAAIKLPAQIRVPKELTVRPTSQGQSLHAANGMIRPMTTFNHAARASRPGFYGVPAFYIEVYGKAVVVPEAQLEALEELPADHEPARRLVVETTGTNFFVGQSIGVRACLFGSRANTIEGLAQLQINGDGFVADKNFRASVETIERSNRAVATLVYQSTVKVAATGLLKLSAQAFTAGIDFGGPIVIRGQVTIPGGPARNILLDSDPLVINARPLPPGELAGFTGAVGKFSCDPPRLETNTVRLGDPVQLSVVIRGENGAGQIVPPPPPRLKSWQIFPASAGEPVPATESKPPGVAFRYTLIPVSAEIRATPAIPFSCFDPQTEKYLDLTVAAVPVTVTGEALPAEIAATLSNTELESEPAKKLSLSGLALTPGKTAGSLTPVQSRGWFPFVQLSPVIVFLGLWQFERRRRFLELHPEVVRRRRARRELRRTRRLLNRACAARDEDGFVRRAIQALQVACAPHYPAEPRALVCGEVTALLDPADRDGRGGEIVQQFFDAANAARFALTTQPGGDLFARQTELDAVLQKLEARL
ncbi:MAG: hypothetical protein EXS35_03280 [Pedosphaera sp.]|nr:hypothetical protein [Pedosphaera sp.]